MKDSPHALSRYATSQEVMSERFMTLNTTFDDLAGKYNLPDHSDVNSERYPWAIRLLNYPQIYAARLWEYPFAVFSAELQPRMQCADIGCGMTAFTLYLKHIAKCEVVGVDPDIFASGIRYKGHGVSLEYKNKTGLSIVQGTMDNLPFLSNAFDRVFCLSVIEHLPPEIARYGVQEMTRILKPGGRLIITVDVNMHSEISNPLNLIWESGLLPLGEIDLQWPIQRFGIFCDREQPADVFGMTLIKDDHLIEAEYPTSKDIAPAMIPLSQVPLLLRQKSEDSHDSSPPRPLWRRLGSRLKRALLVLIKG